MSECLYCGEPIIDFTSWRTLFSRERPKLCETCRAQFQRLEGPSCPICSRPQGTEKRCGDCRRWEADPRWSGVLQQNVSLFTYNEAMKEWMALWKYRGDAVLAEAFRTDICRLYQEHARKAVPVPIPLSAERLEERGFNQAALLAAFAAPPGLIPDVLIRTRDAAKQSKKSRAERLSTASSPFQAVAEKSWIRGKNFVLFDDIYTTGTTLRKAAKELKKHGAENVCSITLARG